MSWSNHLATGLKLLGERWFEGPRRWIVAGENPLDKAVRAAMVAGMGYGLWRLVSSSWTVLALAVLVVVFKALRVATKAAKEQPAQAERASLEKEYPPDETQDGLPTEAQFLDLIHDALGTANGVHLRTLAGALTNRHGGTWDVAAARRLCEAYGVPVRATVRAPGGGPTVGVHRDDLTPLPDRPDATPADVDVADYTAGQNAATPPTTTAPTTPTTGRTERTVGDFRIVTTDDPDNPARARTRVIRSVG